MALGLRWYDSFCLVIVVAAVLVSLWMIKKREGGRRLRESDRSEYESLLSVATRNCDPTDLPLPVAAAVPGSGNLRYDQLWQSCWEGVHPTMLLVTRLVSAAVMATVLSRDILRYNTSILLYYTEWTFALVIVYFAIATVISAHGCWIYSKRCITEDEEANRLLKSSVEQNNSVTLPFITNNNLNAIRLQNNCEEEVDCKRAGFWGYAMQLIYQTSAGAVMLTDIVFWVFLVPFLSSEHFGVNAIMCCMHSLNAVFLLIDTFLNNLPFPWFRMAYFILWSCIYVTFQWVIHACGFSWWPYPFLELNTPWAPLWYFAMAVMHVPCYVLFWLIVRAKYHFLPKFFPNAFVRTF